MPVGMVTGIIGGKKSKKAAKKQKVLAREVQKEVGVQADSVREQFQLERAMVGQQRRQERVQATREARIKRAQIIGSAAGAGVGQGSSAIQGASSALATQFASSMGLANVFTRLQDQSAAAQSTMMDSQGRVAMMQGRSELINANLGKSLANVKMWGGVAQSVMDIGGRAFGAPAGLKGLTTSLLGGNSTSSNRDFIFGK
jgi:hypothetical protein